MKRIQTYADIEMLEQEEKLPVFYIDEIKRQLLGIYEAEGENESLTTYSLPNYACIYHLNKSDDKQWLFEKIQQFEFVEVEKGYYRIGIMEDHQMSLVYFLKGTFSEKIETWLAN